MFCKAYEVAQPTDAQFNLNYSIIRTRRVVECAFGRLKGRFQVLVNSRLSNDVFAADVAMVCCALHNLIEEHGERLPRDRWVASDPADLNVLPVPQAAPDGSAGAMRNKLAQYLLEVANVPKVTYDRRAFEIMLHGPVGFDN